jgi:phosphatidylglycerophosphate synthase
METAENNVKYDYEKSLKQTGIHSLLDAIKFVDLYLNRPLASLIVRAVFNTRITPNQLTYFSSFIGLLAAFFMSRGTYEFLVLGGVLAQLSSIIDGADGMLARAKNMCSRFGAYLDLLLDRVIDFSFFVGLSIGTATYFENHDFLYLGLLGSGLYMLLINLFYITKEFQQNKQTGETGEMRALLLLVMVIFCITGRPDLFVYVGILALSIANAGRIFYFISLGREKKNVKYK